MDMAMTPGSIRSHAFSKTLSSFRQAPRLPASLLHQLSLLFSSLVAFRLSWLAGEFFQLHRRLNHWSLSPGRRPVLCSVPRTGRWRHVSIFAGLILSHCSWLVQAHAPPLRSPSQPDHHCLGLIDCRSRLRNHLRNSVYGEAGDGEHTIDQRTVCIFSGGLANVFGCSTMFRVCLWRGFSSIAWKKRDMISLIKGCLSRLRSGLIGKITSMRHKGSFTFPAFFRGWLICSLCRGMMKTMTAASFNRRADSSDGQFSPQLTSSPSLSPRPGAPVRANSSNSTKSAKSAGKWSTTSVFLKWPWTCSFLFLEVWSHRAGLKMLVYISFFDHLFCIHDFRVFCSNLCMCCLSYVLERLLMPSVRSVNRQLCLLIFRLLSYCVYMHTSLFSFIVSSLFPLLLIIFLLYLMQNCISKPGYLGYEFCFVGVAWNSNISE